MSPRPVSSSLSPRVGKAFFGEFPQPRPFQTAAFAPILAGQDTLIRAGTGSGKTEAAAAPLVERYLQDLDAASGVVVVYVSPTRALANDLARRLEPVLDRVGIKVGVRHGERDDLARAQPPGLVITTPESLDVLVGKQHAALSTVRAVVLDEVHLLQNTQRGQQLAIAMHRLGQWLDRDLQVVGLSATVATGRAIWDFFRPGRTFEEISDPGGRPLNLQIRIALNGTDLAALLHRLSDGPSSKVLVFVNSRRDCDELASDLRTASGFGDLVFAHHASLEKDERLRVEHDFESAPRAICVATMTLELGIDIGDISLVVLYGVPSGWQSFLQRIGRGNRRTGEAQALGIVPIPRKGQLGPVARLGFQTLRRQVDAAALDREEAFDLYGAAAQQLVSHIAANGGGYVGINRLTELLAPWPHLNPSTTEAILDELVAQDILQQHPTYRRYGASEGLHELVHRRNVWSNLPMGSREIELRHGSRPLGRIPASNLLRLTPGRTFTFTGRPWKVVRTIGDAVDVSPASGRPDTQLIYGRSGAKLDPGLADQLRELIANGDPGEAVKPERNAVALRNDFGPLAPYAAADRLPWTRAEGRYIYFTFAGWIANQVIGSWLGLPDDQKDPLRLVTTKPVDLRLLPTSPPELSTHLARIDLPDEELSFFQKSLPAELRRRELTNLWTQHPAHRRVLTRLRAATPVAIAPAVASPLLD